MHKAWLEPFALTSPASQLCAECHDTGDPGFNPKRYWRGPTWAIVNYLVARGLEEYGFEEKAARIRLDTRKVIQESGLAEQMPSAGCGMIVGADVEPSAQQVELLLLHVDVLPVA